MSLIIKRLIVVLAVGFSAILTGCGSGGGGAVSYPIPALSSINSTATASGSANTTFIVYGRGFNTLSAASPVSGYSVDFRDQTTGNVIGSASWLAGGWHDTYIKAIVPNTLTVGTTYNVTVTTPGGVMTSSASFLVTQEVSFNPSTLAWSKTSALPVAMQGFPTVVAPLAGGTYIYTLGGNIGLSGYGGAMTSNVADVNFNQLNMTTSASGNAGSLVNTSWTKTTALPALRGFSAGAIATSFNSLVPAAANGFVYVLGGLDASGTAQNTVYYAQINSDGTVGTWNTTTSLPQPLFGHAVAIFHGRLYVAGGNDASGTPTKTVYSAVIEVDGTLGFWSTYTALPTAVAYHQLVTAGGVLYILGGTSSAGVNPTSSTQSAASSKTVYYNLINIVDGTLAASWMTNSNSMIKNDEKHTAVAVGANILVSGGLFGATGSTSFQTGEEYYAAVNADGSLGSFNGATGSNTINSVSGTTFFNHSVAFFADAVGKPHVLILGGQDILGSVMNADVWYQQ